MRALVTGAAGFAGSHLAEYLLGQGLEVVALVRPQDELNNLTPILGQVQVERCDIREKDRLTDLFRETKPQRVYHLAALSSPAESLHDPRQTYEINLMGTLNLLEAVRQVGLACRFLYVSSSEVYGKVSDDELPLREEAALRPANPYASSKAAGEVLTSQFVRSYDIEAICVRPFNHTGPRQPAAFVCSGLAQQIAEVALGVREPAIHVGNLEFSRDFTDVRDIVRGYFFLLEKGAPGEVYQLCSGRPVRIGEILEVLKRSLSTPVQVHLEAARVNAYSARTAWGVADKAERTANWKPQYSLETTLRDLVAYWEGVLRANTRLRH
jgi:GDP-4-dehydro-6-deoxy-D-mannose reductase